MSKHIFTFETPKGQESFSYLPVKEEGIPHTLKSIPQWVVWFAAVKIDMSKETKPDKIPLQVNFAAASSTDYKTWTTFNDALAFYKLHAGKVFTKKIYGKNRTGMVAGIGFVLSGMQSIVGVDIDKCVDEKGTLSDFARETVGGLDTYTEYSVSGTGIRCFAWGEIPKDEKGKCRNKHPKLDFEMYESARYLTVNGHVVNGDDVMERYNEVNELYNKVFPQKRAEKKAPNINPKLKDTSKILELAFKAKNGHQIKQLFGGDFSAYNSQSEADQAFCNYMAFWCGGDFGLMDEVFRASGLMRDDKWDKVSVKGQTYGAATIEKAIASCSSFYGENKNQDVYDERLGVHIRIAKEVKMPKIDEKVSPNDTISPFDFPDVTDKFKPLSTILNVEFLFAHYGIVCRYNEIKRSYEYEIPWATFSQANKAIGSIAEITSLCCKNNIPTKDIDQYIKRIADKNSYNPVKDWILSKEWDGVSRLNDIFNTVVTSTMDVHFKNVLLYRWLLSCVAAIFQDKFHAHGVLVFAGEQGIGKTSWVKRLAPDYLDAIHEGAIIDPANKDHVLNATSHWIVELGEIDATFRKADIARLKSFVTQSTDKVRRPYDKAESIFPRLTVFFASVNEEKFLVDNTGNRRWWTLPVSELDYEHDIDMQQLWAELYTLYQSGEQWWLSGEEFESLNTHNVDFEQIDPIEERVISLFDTSVEYRNKHMNATTVLLEIGIDKPTKSQTNLCAAVLRKYFGKPKKTMYGLLYQMPEKRSL